MILTSLAFLLALGTACAEDTVTNSSTPNAAASSEEPSAADNSARDLDPAQITEMEAIASAALADPSAADPMALIYVSNNAWRKGDRLHAAFWYYVWKVRTTPYARAMGSTDTYAVGRYAIDVTVGYKIGEWIGSDPVALQATLDRAVSYEASLPVPSERPEGMSAEAWNQLFAKTRTEFRQALTELSAKPPASVAEARRAQGMAVGPLSSPGAPLKDEWR